MLPLTQSEGSAHGAASRPPAGSRPPGRQRRKTTGLLHTDTKLLGGEGFSKCPCMLQAEWGPTLVTGATETTRLGPPSRPVTSITVGHTDNPMESL